MRLILSNVSEPLAPPPISTPANSELRFWSGLHPGWKPLQAHFHTEGFSFEWHDFTSNKALDWGRSFHPQSLEICLNLAGRGSVRCGSEEQVFKNETIGYYVVADRVLEATRVAGDHHQFLTLELSLSFVRQQLGAFAGQLAPILRRLAGGGRNKGTLSEVSPLSWRLNQLLNSLRNPPVFQPAQALWYKSKALEVMSEVLFQPDEGELFCTRQKRQARERVERVVELLKDRLAEPPALDEIGRLVGCSPYYLSRTFSQEMGMTIPQFLRKLRMERAAQLLLTGRHNVTEVAFEVGYNSLSHFSQAFCQSMGCCPAIYSARTAKRS